MAFATLSTADIQANAPTKVLLVSHHGFGKTWQCRNYQKRFGKGLILSGEAGLKSIEDVDIDYLPFSSWDGKHDPEAGIFSFRGIVKMLHTDDFRDAGYKWIAIDSLTELSERLLEHLEREHKDAGNGFAMWGDYNRLMMGSLKWIRDLPMHVYVTCLAKEEKDANDVTHYWPLVKGSGVSKHVPAIFDHVLCGVRSTERDDTGTPRVRRHIITDEVSGWHGKVRDPLGRIKPQERVDDITELLVRMSMSEEEFAAISAPKEPTKKEEANG